MNLSTLFIQNGNSSLCMVISYYMICITYNIILQNIHCIPYYRICTSYQVIKDIIWQFMHYISYYRIFTGDRNVALLQNTTSPSLWESLELLEPNVGLAQLWNSARVCGCYVLQSLDIFSICWKRVM